MHQVLYLRSSCSLMFVQYFHFNLIFSMLMIWVTAGHISENDIVISFIGDILNFQKKVAPPAIVTAFLCWKSEQLRAMDRFLSTNYVFLSIHSMAEKHILHKYNFHKRDGYKTFILDMGCKDAKKIVFQANEMNMFRGQHRWLLLNKYLYYYNVTLTNVFSNNSENVHSTSSTKKDYEISNISYLSKMFNSTNILIDSDVTIASRESDTKICLYEIYRRGPLEKTVINKIGIWENQIGIQLTVPTAVATRRFNLQQTTLNAITVITDDSTIDHLEDGVDRDTDAFSKTTYVQTKHVTDMINATLKNMFTRSWGAFRNGSWDGLTGYLERQEADIGTTPMFVMKERLAVAYYISSPVPGLPFFLFRKPPLSVVKNIFTLPFSQSIWIASAVLLFGICILLYGIFKWEAWSTETSENIENGNHLNYNAETLLKMATLSDVILISVATICEQGTEIEAEKPTGRIVTLLHYISIMFLYTAYTACIVALLQSTTDSIRTLKDLYDSGMEIGVWDTPYNRHYFAVATDPIKKAIYHERVNPPGGPHKFLGMTEGMENIRKGFYAFHTTMYGYKFMDDTFEVEEKCGVQQIFFFDDLSDAHIAVSKHTSFKEIISLGFRRLHESGIQVRIFREFYYKKPVCEGTNAYYLSVGISDCYPVLLIFGYGISCSVLILLLEIYVHRVLKKRRMKITGSSIFWQPNRL